MNPLHHFIFTAVVIVGVTAFAAAAPATSPTREIVIDADRVKGQLNRAFQFSVGSDRALIHLRPEHQRDLRFVKETSGFQYMRFHGLLNEEMHVVHPAGDGKLAYDWTRIDGVYDFLVNDLKIRPIVELGFMPEPLASGDKTIFWWKGNVTAPKSYDQWADLIEQLTHHFTERYGADEVRHWYFEVWNEPNLTDFWPAGQAEYFKLYDVTAAAVKRVDASYRVGGPSTAGFGWIKEMLDHCAAANAPIDFISTHAYGAMEGFLDEAGKGKTMLAPENDSVINGLPDVLAAVHNSRWPTLPVLVTEWGPSYSARDPVHDSYFCAAWILHRLRRLPAGVEAMSYWTFSDQFEEAGLADRPFHGGFGLLTWQGLPKPAYYAYRFLNELGGTELTCGDENAWACRDDAGGTQVIFWDYHPPKQDAPNNPFFTRNPPATATSPARLVISGLPSKSMTVQITRVGYRHNDVYSAYLDAGSPPGEAGKPYLLTDNTLAKLRAAAPGTPEKRTMTPQNGQLKLELPMNENDVYCVTVSP